LAATGLRISEALNLLVFRHHAQRFADPQNQVSENPISAFARDCSGGPRPLPDPSSGYPSGWRPRLRFGGRATSYYWKVHSLFRTLLKSAGLKPSRGRWPRIHDLRHTFAVRALESSPTGRQRIGQHMLALATYMGHVNINATCWYLETTPELLRDIAAVTENFAQKGQE